MQNVALLAVAHAWRVKALDSMQGQARARAKMETYRPRVEEMIHESREQEHRKQLALTTSKAKTVPEIYCLSFISNFFEEFKANKTV